MIAVLPLPNDRFGEATVIASVWQNDDISFGPVTALLFLLGEAPPYYTVMQVAWSDDAWRMWRAEHHPNIVPATEAYVEYGGDH